MSDRVLTSDKIATSNIFSWTFCSIFIVIGIANLLFVHPVPGMFYLILSLIYLPRTNHLLKKKLGFSIPLALKIVLGLVVLWATLAVGELAEMVGI